MAHGKHSKKKTVPVRGTLGSLLTSPSAYGGASADPGLPPADAGDDTSDPGQGTLLSLLRKKTKTKKGAR